jgi:hypothetical protein
VKALLAIVLLSSLAAAEPRELRKLLAVADDAYAHGFYGDALGAYRDAYQLAHDSTLLLKIGNCLEKLGNPGDAALTYRNYVAEANLSSGERSSMQAKIAALEARARPAPSPIAIAAPAPVPPAPPPPPPNHVVGLRRAMIVSAIATAATFAVAGGLTIGAASAYSQLNDDCRALSSGCSGGASDRLSALNHSADAIWTLAAVGVAATLTLHLILRHEKQHR